MRILHTLHTVVRISVTDDLCVMGSAKMVGKNTLNEGFVVLN